MPPEGPSHPSDGSPVPIAHAKDTAEGEMLQYGLELRGIRCTLARTTLRHADPIQILVSRDDSERANAALPLIWDAILELPRAIRRDGSCPFCGYSNIGIPPTQPCPECGVLLSSVEARRAYRDGRSVRQPPANP